MSDVEFAILEAHGQLPVIPKSQKRPVTPHDLGIETTYEGIPIPLILDGRVEKENLNNFGLNPDGLQGELARRKLGEPEQLLLVVLDTGGSFTSLKNHRFLSSRLSSWEKARTNHRGPTIDLGQDCPVGWGWGTHDQGTLQLRLVEPSNRSPRKEHAP